ncbi:uncharacterized protein PGRI_003130 [Penicillium griseofulvum]|uniref:Uncharacterized protein n=1 Tax=Penicillium patulum TaxID=5078 RepID=A0A135LWB6_PENPA|nr:uncharacterized protein PGRI_003130 [Penicillium griseofulvum]KXG53263.1 hypothetical protein PGRI_003130 [Penicillium griseofulvum]
MSSATNQKGEVRASGSRPDVAYRNLGPGQTHEEWEGRPPPSKDRVPYLSSYREFEPWVLQVDRQKAENLPADEVSAREWEQQGWEWPEKLIPHLDCYSYVDDWSPIPNDGTRDEPKGGSDEQPERDWGTDDW